MSASMSRKDLFISLGLPVEVATQYGDDMPVFVNLHSSTHRNGHTVLIQRVEQSPLVPGSDGRAIALVAHDGNREVPERRDDRVKPTRSNRCGTSEWGIRP